MTDLGFTERDFFRREDADYLEISEKREFIQN